MELEIWTNLPAVAPSSIRRMTRAVYDKLVGLGAYVDEQLDLIRGVTVRIPPRGPEHTDPIVYLTKLLVRAIADRGDVRVQMPLLAPDESEPEPDVAVVPPTPRGQHPHEALLFIEVSRSRLTLDRDTKGPLYAAMGVADCWIVGRGARVVEVRRKPEGARYRSVEGFAPGQTIALPAFPEVAVEVAALFG